jgi:hypothetical protein
LHPDPSVHIPGPPDELDGMIAPEWQQQPEPQLAFVEQGPPPLDEPLGPVEAELEPPGIVQMKLWQMYGDTHSVLEVHDVAQLVASAQ